MNVLLFLLCWFSLFPGDFASAYRVADPVKHDQNTISKREIRRGTEDDSGNGKPEITGVNANLRQQKQIPAHEEGLRSLTNGSSLSKILQGGLNPESPLLDYLISEIILNGDKEHRVLDDFRETLMQRSYGYENERVMLTQRQKSILAAQKASSHERFKRNFMKTAEKWSSTTINFMIDDSLVQHVGVIYEAMNEISDKTCITFSEVNNIEMANKILFKREDPDSGCWSYIGAVHLYTEQIINIGIGCEYRPIIIHEILHALGFAHEQSRWDRDNHVKVLQNNIRSGYEGNFDRIETDDTVPYNYGSALHYGLYDFSVDPNNLQTLELPDSKLNFLANTRQRLSFYDAQEVNNIYGCNVACASSLICKYGGYVDQSCTCTCPSNLEGPLCDAIHNSNLPDCSAKIDISDGLVHTKSVKFGESSYQIGRTCTWLIVASEGKKVHLTLKEFNLPLLSGVCVQSLELRYHLPAEGGPRFCGGNGANFEFYSFETSFSNLMMLTFDTTQTDVNPIQGNGFVIEAKQVELGYLTDNLVTCTFEDDSPCLMVEANDDNSDWTIATTPRYTFCGRRKTDRYKYISWGRAITIGTTATLITNHQHLSGMWCMAFSYCFRGRTSAGIFSLKTITNEQEYEYEISTASNWIEYQRSITISTGTQIALKFEKAGRGYVEVNVDDISLTEGECQQ